MRETAKARSDFSLNNNKNNNDTNTETAATPRRRIRLVLAHQTQTSFNETGALKKRNNADSQEQVLTTYVQSGLATDST